MPQLRRESGKGAKLRGKVKVGSSSEELSADRLATAHTMLPDFKSYLLRF